MPTRQIQPDDWQQYFDRTSRQLKAANVDVEVSGLDLGVQVEAKHLPLQGFSYDPRDNAFSVVCEGLEHRIKSPRQIAVEVDGQKLKAVEVIDADEHKHIATLTEALELPAE